MGFADALRPYPLAPLQEDGGDLWMQLHLALDYAAALDKKFRDFKYRTVFNMLPAEARHEAREACAMQ